MVQLSKGIKAATSVKPGETQAITFYQLRAHPILTNRKDEIDRKQELCLRLVDLPGYGFSYTSEEQSQHMLDMIISYASLHHGRHSRSSLKRILLLLDARHGMKKADVDFLSHLEQEIRGRDGKVNVTLPPIQLVLTKCDLVKQVDLARRLVLIRERFTDVLSREPSKLPIMLVSARAGTASTGGILELQKELAGMANMEQVPISADFQPVTPKRGKAKSKDRSPEKR